MCIFHIWTRDKLMLKVRSTSPSFHLIIKIPPPPHPRTSRVLLYSLCTLVNMDNDLYNFYYSLFSFRRWMIAMSSAANYLIVRAIEKLTRITWGKAKIISPDNAEVRAEGSALKENIKANLTSRQLLPGSPFSYQIKFFPRLFVAGKTNFG